MPRIKIKRSLDSNISVESTSLLDGELFWDKSTNQLYIGSNSSGISDSGVATYKIQKQITIGNTAPTSETEGLPGDIYIWYQD